MQTFIHGFFVSGGLIVAIGAQNAFVLKQGLLKQHVFTVALICFLCDVLLFNLGVLGLGSLVSQHQTASITLAFVGAAFLFIYALRAWYSAYQGNNGLQVSTDRQHRQRLKTILMTLSITLLNPHVYLDTVVIIGGVAGTLALTEKIWFLLGAVCASGIWFFGLAYGSALLIPLFSKPVTWRILDVVIGVIMLLIAWGLYQYGINLLTS